MEKITIDAMKVSHFDSVRDKHCTHVSFEEVVRRVKTGTCRLTVEALRKCIENHASAAKVKRTKDGLPCFVTIGCCEGGHARKDLVSLSGLLCFDFDHTDGRTREVQRLTATLPHVVTAFVSPSGHGVKVFVKVRPEDIVADYDSLYHTIGRWLSSVLQHPYDIKCAISTQPCFLSYDPEVFYHPDVEPYNAGPDSVVMEDAPEPPPASPTAAALAMTDFHVSNSARNVETKVFSTVDLHVSNSARNGEKASQPSTDDSVINQTDQQPGEVSTFDSSSVPQPASSVAQPASSATAGNSSEPKQIAVPQGSSLLGGSAAVGRSTNGGDCNSSDASAQPLSAPGFIRSFVDRFEHAHPFVRGERNDIALKLGREAARNGLSRAELDEMCKIFAERHYSDDFTRHDIRSRAYAGYQYFMQNGGSHKQENRCHFGASATYGPSLGDMSEILPTEEEEISDEMPADDSPEEIRHHNNEMRKKSPLIPDEVHANLPEFLKRCVALASDERQKDLVLLGSLCCCSVTLPGVRFRYEKNIVFPHFYMGVVAPAGSGKGILSSVFRLLDPTQKYYDELNARQQKEYEQKLLQWEMHRGKSHGKSAKNQDGDEQKVEKPEPVQYVYFKLPPSTSKGRFVQSIRSAGEGGVIMLTTEMMSITASVNQDYGRYEDILLKAAHHEEVSSSFKADGDQPIVAKCPRLSICMSGTQEQFNGFFQSHEAGLFSRFALYTHKQDFRWRSCQPNPDAPDLHTAFASLGLELYAMFRKLLERPVMVNFTDRQWQRHTERYMRLTEHNGVDEQDSTSSIVFRNGLLCCRIAALLTMLRRWDEYLLGFDTLDCMDVDFESALLIAETLLEHSLLLSTSLPQSKNAPMAMKKPHKLDAILAQLSSEFTYTQYISAASSLDIPKTTANRILRRAKTSQIIEKDGNTYRKSNRDEHK